MANESDRFRPKLDRSRETAERDAMAVEMRKAGIGYRDIAATLGIGSVREAYDSVRRGIASIPQESAEELTQLVISRLDFTTGVMMKVMSDFHPVVNNGRVMQDPVTGELLDDPLPKIAAARMLVAVTERTARLYGLDQPKTTITISMDALEHEIRKLEQELGKDMPRGEGGMTAARTPRPEPLSIESAADQDRPQGFR